MKFDDYNFIEGVNILGDYTIDCSEHFNSFHCKNIRCKDYHICFSKYSISHGQERDSNFYDA